MRRYAPLVASCLSVIVLGAACGGGDTESDFSLGTMPDSIAATDGGDAIAFCALASERNGNNVAFASYSDPSKVLDFVSSQKALLTNMVSVATPEVAEATWVTEQTWSAFADALVVNDGDYLATSDELSEVFGSDGVRSAQLNLDAYVLDTCGVITAETAADPAAPPSTVPPTTIAPDNDATPGFEAEEAVTEREVEIFEQAVESETGRALAIEALQEDSTMTQTQAECFVDGSPEGLLAALAKENVSAAQEAELFALLQGCDLPTSAFVD